MDINSKIKEIQKRIYGKSYNLSHEKDVQDKIEQHLFGLNFQREFRLSNSDIVDFLRVEDGLAIEVKTQGQATSIFRKCKKYCTYEQVKVFILATSKSMGFPKEIYGKPCYYISLSRGML